MLKLRIINDTRPRLFCILRPPALRMTMRERKPKNCSHGQMIAEYVVTVAIVIAVFTTMTIFVRRALQGRIRDARNYMVKTASDAYVATQNGETTDTVPYEYEPYYLKQESDVSRQGEDTTRLLPGGTTGIFRKAFNQAIGVNAEFEQLPPKDAY